MVRWKAPDRPAARHGGLPPALLRPPPLLPTRRAADGGAPAGAARRIARERFRRQQHAAAGGRVQAPSQSRDVGRSSPAAALGLSAHGLRGPDGQGRFRTVNMSAELADEGMYCWWRQCGSQRRDARRSSHLPPVLPRLTIPQVCTTRVCLDSTFFRPWTGRDGGVPPGRRCGASKRAEPTSPFTAAGPGTGNLHPHHACLPPDRAHSQTVNRQRTGASAAARTAAAAAAAAAAASGALIGVRRSAVRPVIRAALNLLAQPWP